MSDYFFIQSQDPFTETRTSAQYSLMRSLCAAGHGVSVLLVQNGITPARLNAQSPDFDVLLGSGVQVFIDDLALQQREIDPASIKAPITVGSVDLAIDAMLAGHKVIWN